ncbi:hypothetical protein ACFYRZ_23880 [Streptomyces avermitilis]|uniref:hypothetical protein n=1 Tax=Streptomyces avermitilis TaxID=33903 RepID=UPI0036921EF5
MRVQIHGEGAGGELPAAALLHRIHGAPRGGIAPDHAEHEARGGECGEHRDSEPDELRLCLDAALPGDDSRTVAAVRTRLQTSQQCRELLDVVLSRHRSPAPAP